MYNPKPETIKQWNQAFDQGDQRVQAFYQLWEKQHKDIALTATEKQQLERYVEACEGSGLYDSKRYAKSKALYEKCKLVEAAASTGKKLLLDIKQNGWDIVNVELTQLLPFKDGQFIYYIRTTSPVQTLFLSSQLTRNAVQEGYVHLDAAGKLAEREAWTFMYLTPKAAKVFYPEVYALREKEVNQCAPYSLVPPLRNQRIRIGLFFAGSTRAIRQEDRQAILEDCIMLYKHDNADIKMIKKGLQMLAVQPDNPVANRHLADIAYDENDHAAACRYYSLAHFMGAKWPPHPILSAKPH